MLERYDLLIRGGLVYDGTGAPGRVADVAVKDGRVTQISETPLDTAGAARVVDARGLWVTPGFIDVHTHYDAEIELEPALPESLRHGVTSVIMGSCSLGLTPGSPEVLADIFCRVEAIPYDIVRPVLERKKTWSGLADYFEHLDSLPLGPNVSAFLGHSPLRAHVMGVERSLEEGEKPTADELSRIDVAVEEALDLGYLGVSLMTSPWDKMGGQKAYRSKPLPSYFASWTEYRRMAALLRRRGAILQAVPDITRRVNIVLFLAASAGLLRRSLKTSVISMMDVRSDRTIYRLIGWLSRAFNVLLGADFKWQSLPEVFDLWADGMDLVVFEEFGAGAAALHFEDPDLRRKLITDPEYRARFKKEWRNRFLPKAFHRDFNQSKILECPDRSVVGKSFAQVAAERGMDAVDAFLDLVAAHGSKLRWYTVMGNDRREPLERIVSHPDVLIGFSDAGAHLRQMAHYNFPLRMLRLVRQAQTEGRAFMPVEAAVRKLTGELAEWFGIDAGVLAAGRRADLVVIDPAKLDAAEQIAEAPMEKMGGYVRLVRRNDETVPCVVVNGRVAVEKGALAPGVGRERGFGRLLRAKTAKGQYECQALPRESACVQSTKT